MAHPEQQQQRKTNSHSSSDSSSLTAINSNAALTNNYNTTTTTTNNNNRYAGGGTAEAVTSHANLINNISEPGPESKFYGNANNLGFEAGLGLGSDQRVIFLKVGSFTSLITQSTNEMLSFGFNHKVFNGESSSSVWEWESQGKSLEDCLSYQICIAAPTTDLERLIGKLGMEINGCLIFLTMFIRHI